MDLHRLASPIPPSKAGAPRSHGMLRQKPNLNPVSLQGPLSRADHSASLRCAALSARKKSGLPVKQRKWVFPFPFPFPFPAPPNWYRRRIVNRPRKLWPVAFLGTERDLLSPHREGTSPAHTASKHLRPFIPPLIPGPELRRAISGPLSPHTLYLQS